MIQTLKGQVALVTGAARRLGREIAFAIARQGAHIVIHYHGSEEEAMQLSREIAQLGVKSWAIQADFQRREEYENLIPRALDLSERLDILVNNAAIFQRSDIAHLNLDELLKDVEINSWVPFHLTRSFAQTMGHGRVVNLLDSRIQGHDWAHVGYVLSKHLLAILTEMSAMEFSPGIMVNAVAPGLILPPEGQTQSYLEAKAKAIPLKTFGHPSDIGDAVIYLLTASFVTGTVIYVDGGQHLRGTTHG